jgi:hypothetical protein
MSQPTSSAQKASALSKVLKQADCMEKIKIQKPCVEKGAK